MSLEYVQHKKSDILTIKVPDSVVEALELHQMELQSMIGMGKFVAFFKERVNKWQHTLGCSPEVDVSSSLLRQVASLDGRKDAN